MAAANDRFGNIEHLNNRLWREGSLEIKGKNFTAEEVVARLGDRLTEERKTRINQVIEHRSYSVACVGEHLYDIGNISAVMRSFESYGFLPFHIIERDGSRYKKSDRISKGTEKWLDIHKSNETVTAVMGLQKSGYKVYATSLETTHEWQDIDFSQKVAIVFGNERDGISTEMKNSVDGIFKIPMYGFAQSFNISVAASIVFSNIHRERLEKLGKSGDLTEDEKMHLRASYYLRTCDRPEIYF